MTARSEGTRIAHLVGTVPAAGPEDAMRLALDKLDGKLRWLPDGETGERLNWIVNIIEAMRSHPDLELAKEGDWSDYDKTPRFRVRKGHKLRADSLDFGHVACFRESYPIFRGLREEAGMPDLRFQVGVPGSADMANFVLGPAALVRGRKPFHEATVREIREIHGEAGEDVVFQIEVPLELVLAAKSPSPLRGAAAHLLAGLVVKVAADSPAGAHFGVHLCLGDMNHEALANMADMAPVVSLANAIVARWPAHRPLDFVHAPFAGAGQAPTLRPEFYEPLSALRIPPQTRLIAGFVYEHQSLEEQEALLRTIDRAAGRPVDVSSACGLGRRSLEEAEAAMDRTRALIDGA